jgi:CDP-6-deoxy-D-xylo-4-hexulose-3-dehydrase
MGLASMSTGGHTVSMSDAPEALQWPLMKDNVSRPDLQALIDYLSQPEPRLTHGPKVREFEDAWAQWVGTQESVMVNSGSSANELTLMALRHMYGDGEVIMSPLGWVSDVAAVLHAGLTPRFVDIDPVTLSLSVPQTLDAIGSDTRAVLLVHILGLNGLTEQLLSGIQSSDTPLIEDVCESHGAVFGDKRCGTFGLASNFSFYFAHHMTTIEGGAVNTDDPEFADVVRVLRSHGMLRESRSASKRQRITNEHPDLNPDFIFLRAAHNYRPTELNAVLGLSQLPRLDDNVSLRKRNFQTFMAGLDGERFRTEFDTIESSNYAFITVLQEPDWALRDRIESTLRRNGIEFRRGLSGGGSQIRQPYLRDVLPGLDPNDYPNAEHVHHFGWYIGNYPELELSEVNRLCDILNGA